MTDMKRYIIYIALCLVAAVSCEQLPDDVKIYGVGCIDPEKGTPLHEVSLGVDPGQYQLKVYADGDFTAMIEEGAEWIRFSADPASRVLVGNGDVTIDLVYDINKGIPRTALLTLERGTNVFEVSLTQDGILEGGIDFEQKNISVPSQGGQFGAKVMTKIRQEDISFEVVYDDSEDSGWITGLGLKNNFITFDVKANLSGARIRHAVIMVSYAGGKGQIQVSQFYDGCSMAEMSVDEIKGLISGSALDYVFDTHIVLHGVVINEHSEKNGAENRLVSAESCDLEYAERVAYVQNEDGSQGIKLVFKEKCTGVVSRFDRISVDLIGLTLKKENDPERYSVTGIPVSAIVGTISADAPSPTPLKLEELTPEHLYTLVTVSDVEIPVRKGSYAPVDIRDIGVMTAYPMVIRSKGGATGHMMVNVDCPWSRNGKALPTGSGSITGVVVHEKCDNFEWDPVQEEALKATGINASYITGLGRIGDYQIRPMTQEDVRLQQEPFSELMYEWAYCDTLGVNLVANYSGQTMYPTYPLVENPKTLDAGFYCVNVAGSKALLKHCNDFSHLGPYVYGKYMSDHSNGNGIFDYQGRSAHWRRDQGGEKYGVLYSNEAGRRWEQDNAAAWCTQSWSVDQYWCMDFPTSELSSANSPLNLTFGTMNSITKGPGAPRYWLVQWKTNDGDWEDVMEYTVPDFVDKANRRVYQLPGTKFITVNLPDEALGQERIYVRLKPKDATTGTASSYNGGTSIKSGCYNAINYVAIRYNK